MKNFLQNSVIVPVDFQELSLGTLRMAIETVESLDKIEVVHVAPCPTDAAVFWGQATEQIIADRVNETWREFVNKHGLPDLNFTLFFGDPGTRLAEFAKEKNAGLIMIASHGRTGLNRVLLGSVAERVVRLSTCPVLVIREDDG